MPLSPVVRLAPFLLGEVPDHPLFHRHEASDSKRPDLLPFLLTLLDHGNGFVSNPSFDMTFKPHSRKPAPPSNTDVDVLTYSIPGSELSTINWTETSIPEFKRSKPRQLQTEHWFARRSLHKNVSSKTNSSTASWDEFVYGLRDEHSKHEYDFTPTLYDAHHILDWNEEISRSAKAWNLSQRHVESPGMSSYTNITMSIYEMCHAIPWPLQPRCFPVLVVTASTDANRFIAVTVPVVLDNFPAAFYSNQRNITEGADRQQKKSVVLGQYTAVEQVQMFDQDADGDSTGTKKEQVIEWIMATASDAGGNLPMSVQKSSMPSQIPKDVTYFLSWIKDVPPEEIRAQGPATSDAI